MHANILQYQHYLTKHRRRRDLNRIILLTPNEGLSHQHLRELAAAGIHAELFDKNGRGLFAGRAVEIIDINKLRDVMGDKTVAVDAFEDNNLVLIDEGGSLGHCRDPAVCGAVSRGPGSRCRPYPPRARGGAGHG
jgi:hypothetical protein